jgi:transposase
VIVDIDEIGPVAAKSDPGRHLVCAASQALDGGAPWRAKQEADYERRGKGYVFGAFIAARGEALTDCYGRRTTAHFVDFLVPVEAWVPAEAEHVYAIMDNRSVHRSAAVLLFSAQHPRWRFVFQPTYAPYLNLIEPWWKTLRSLALKGRRFERWEEIVQAIREATHYWNGHRHPFVWGRRRRRQPQRRPGIAQVANVA